MTKISKIKSSSDLDKKELFPVCLSLSLKVWSSLDSDNKDEDNIDTGDPDISYSDFLYILGSLVCSLWKKSKFYIKNDFTVTGRMLCVIPYICKY